MCTVRFSRCAVMLALFATAAVALADNKNPKGLADDIKRQEKEISEARKKVSSAKHEADAAKGALQKASATFERAADKVGDVRRSVQAEHDAAPSLIAARKRVETSRAELERLTTPLLERLKQSPEYVAALAARDQAKSQLAALPSGATKKERDDLEKVYAEGIMAFRQLEKAAIDADAQAKAARAAVDDAETYGRQLLERRDQAIDQDSRLKSAKNDLDAAKSALAKAKSKLESEMRQLTGAQKHLQAEEHRKRELEQKQKQQNNNKKPQNKKK